MGACEMIAKEKWKAIAKDYAFIVAGTFFLAVAINVFMAPNKVSAGGVTAIGIVLLHLFGIRISVTNLVINVVLFFFGFRKLGKYAVIQTASGIVLLSLFLELTSLFPAYTGGDILISSIAGGILLGFGVGLVVRQGASTGGCDFAGLILKKIFPHIPLATLIMLIDVTIVLVSGIVFKSLSVTFYSVLALIISSVVTDKIITFGDSAKKVQIFSSHAQEISEHILTNFERGVTGIHCIGMYGKNEMLMLECIVKPRELPRYLSMVKKLDPGAFVIIGNVQEVLGEGFKPMS